MKLFILITIFLSGFVGVIFGEPITINIDLSPMQAAALRNLAIRSANFDREIASNADVAKHLLVGVINRQAKQLQDAAAQQEPAEVEAAVARVVGNVNARLLAERQEKRKLMQDIARAKAEAERKKAEAETVVE